MGQCVLTPFHQAFCARATRHLRSNASIEKNWKFKVMLRIAAPGSRTKQIQTQEATNEAEKMALHMGDSRAASGCRRPRDAVGSRHMLVAPGAALGAHGTVFGSRFS